MILLLASALAQDVAIYPSVADVPLSPTGVQRVHLPVEMHDVAYGLDSRNVRLLDGRGEAVPFVLLTGPMAPATVRPVDGAPGGREPFAAWRTPQGSWGLAVRDPNIRDVRVTFSDREYSVNAMLLQGGETVARVHLWRREGGTPHGDLPLNGQLGEFELLFDVGTPSAAPKLQGLRYDPRHVPDERVDLALGSPSWREDAILYSVPLTHPHPLTHVEIRTADTLFSREARAWMPDAFTHPDEGSSTPIYGQSVYRKGVGQAVQEQLSVPVESHPHGQSLVLGLDAGTPLAIDGLTGRFPGVHLIVSDPGEGPFRLYAGGPAQEASPSLAFAIDVLAGQAGEPIAIESEPNPDFVPSWVRRAAPSTRPVALEDMEFTRAVEGASGPIRIALDQSVLQHAQPDLDDLRLVDGQGNEVPYLLRRDPDPQMRTDPTKRIEEGRIRVDLPGDNVLVGDVHLRTEDTFERDLSIVRRGATRDEVVRRFSWRTRGGGSTRVVRVDRRFSDSLDVTWDNGANPDIALEVTISEPRFELVSVMPEGGLTLVYGDKNAHRPRYDAELLQVDVLRALGEPAVLGVEEERAPTPLTWFQRVVLAAGVLVMALGLVALLVSLVLRGPDEDAAEDEPDESGPSEEGDQGSP